MSDLKFIALAERTHQPNQLIHRKARVWRDVPIHFEKPTQPLGALDPDALESSAGPRRQGNDFERPGEPSDGGSLGVQSRGAEEGGNARRRRPAGSSDGPLRPVIRVKDTSHPLVREPSPRADPLASHLVLNEPLRQVETAQVLGIAIL
jgi:hypothetical protein